MDTSFTIYSSCTKFYVPAEYIHMQGSVSQNFDLCLCYFFITSEKVNEYTKLSF